MSTIKAWADWFYRPVLITATVLYVLFLLAAKYVPHAVLLEAHRLIQLTMSAAVVAAYGPTAVRAAFARRQPDVLEQLAIGITLSFATLLGQGLWSLAWRLSGQPFWMVNTDVTTFWVLNLILAASLHLLPPGSINDRVPARNKRTVLLCAFGGLVLALATSRMDLDLSWMVDAMRPLFEEKASGMHFDPAVYDH